VAFLKKVLTFLAELLGTFWDIHKSEEKFSKKILTPPPLKIFLNPNPTLWIFGQAHI